MALSLKHTPPRRVHPRRRPNRQRCAGVTHHGFRGDSDTNKGCGAGLDNGKEADGDASWVRCGWTERKSGVEGKRRGVRVDIGGRRNRKKKKHNTDNEKELKA